MISATIVKKFAAGPESAPFRLDVEFEAAAGVTAIFGPSGAGKSLTLESIAGFATPDAGRIMIDNRILFDAESGINLPPRERNCGYVFQNYALFPHMTLRENLAFAANGLPRLERHRRIAEQLELFKLSGMAGRYPRELSGGQKQRASIARALIAKPRIVLLDEPGRGLDPELRFDLFAVIQQLKEELRIPVLLVTHDPEYCFALAGRVLIYDAGRIVHTGTPAELHANPATADVARIFGGFTILEAEVISLDPGRQTSVLRLLDSSLDGGKDDGKDEREDNPARRIQGPNLRGCFKGDRVSLCIRPEELIARAQPGGNRLRATLRQTVERPQSIRADFGKGLIVDVPRETWRALLEISSEEDARRNGWWIEVPAHCLRQIGAPKIRLSTLVT